MKGTVFAVALNHQSQREAWREAFEKAPYNTPPKTAVWFIKPHNTVIRAGEPIPFPHGETVLSGATVALVVGKTASKVRPEDAAEYIAGYALANEVSLPEESFYRPAIKAKCRDGFCPLGELVAVGNVDNLTIIIDNNGLQIDGTNDEVMSLGDLPAKLRAFGLDLHEIDGHDMDTIEAALSAPAVPGKPKCILAHTVKGKGVSFMENQVGWHGKAPNEEQRRQALKELED